MALTNNTKLRKKTLTITKKINGSLVTVGGFPLTVSILNAFTSFAAITVEQFRTMNDADYLTRVNAFYTNLEAIYPFWNRSTVLNAYEETNAILCPLDNTAAPVLTVTSIYSSMTPVGSATTDNHLEWGINLDSVVSQDTPYFFDIEIYDKNNNLLRVETVFGIVLAGTDSHFSGLSSYYISEADNNFYQPLRPVELLETVVLN
jgi:hypothetical protein